MNYNVNIQMMKKQLMQIRVDALCDLLPEAARAVGTYNRALKRQGVSRKARNLCCAALSDVLLNGTNQQPIQEQHDYE